MRKWKYVFIIAVLGYAAWMIIPTARYYGMSAEERDALTTEQKAGYNDSAIKLGLDLQGGMHMVLEVDDSQLSDDAKKDAVDRIIKILRNRIDQFGVAEPVIQKQGERRVIVQLPGLTDAERARELIGRTAQLEFRMVQENEELARVVRQLDVALKGVEVGGGTIDTLTIESMEDTEVPPVELALGDTTSSDSLPDIPSIPGIPEVDDLNVPLGQVNPDAPFSSYIVTAFDGGFVVDEGTKDTVDGLLNTEQAKRVIPRGAQFLWDMEARPLQGGGMGRVLYLCDQEPILAGGMLVNATTQPDPDNPSSLNVGFELNRQGALIFSRVTGENIGRRLAIVLDENVSSAPVIQSKIPGGSGRITGDFTDEEANDLAIVLRSGALPADIEIIEERTVGPTLGRDSIVSGMRAAGIGFVLVMLFMAIYYQASGLLACLALLLNLAIVLAVLTQLRAALTLPGIAGLILTIGMAVDANVLIFERIREELAKGKTVRSSIDAGYERAFTTILDANLTTLITAFVLWQFGTGPIKGFATVLSVGIIASMFTALMCTRVVFDLITNNRQLRKLSI